MVVLIAGISFIGYIAIKILGNKRGEYMTGIFGGLVSSTAVSSSLSKLYALEKTYLKNFVGGMVLAETAVFNSDLAKSLALPYISGTIAGLAFVSYFYKHEKVYKVEHITVTDNLLELSQALKLGLLFDS